MCPIHGKPPKELVLAPHIYNPNFTLCQRNGIRHMATFTIHVQKQILKELRIDDSTT
jgi:hypothetical protein